MRVSWCTRGRTQTSPGAWPRRGLVPGTDVERQDATVKSSEFSVQHEQSDYELKTSQAASDAGTRHRVVLDTTRDMTWTRSYTDRSVRLSGNAVDNVTLQRERAQDDVVKTVINAPASGLVVLSPLGDWQGNTHLPRQGDFISQGREIGEIASLEHMQVKLELDQKQITGVRMGQSAEVVIEALPDLVLKGKVSSIGQTARRPPIEGWQGVSSSATFPVTVDLPPAGKIMIAARHAGRRLPGRATSAQRHRGPHQLHLPQREAAHRIRGAGRSVRRRARDAGRHQWRLHADHGGTDGG